MKFDYFGICENCKTKVRRQVNSRSGIPVPLNAISCDSCDQRGIASYTLKCIMDKTNEN